MYTCKQCLLYATVTFYRTNKKHISHFLFIMFKVMCVLCLCSSVPFIMCTQVGICARVQTCVCVCVCMSFIGYFFGKKDRADSLPWAWTLFKQRWLHRAGMTAEKLSWLGIKPQSHGDDLFTGWESNGQQADSISSGTSDPTGQVSQQIMSPACLCKPNLQTGTQIGRKEYKSTYTKAQEEMMGRYSDEPWQSVSKVWT